MAINPFEWECPHCATKQIVTDPKWHATFTHIFVRDHKHNSVGINTRSIGCANPTCKELTVSIVIGQDAQTQTGWFLIEGGNTLFSRRILPNSAAKPQPEYIPPALREDYLEACLIRDDSPKAAATLARRCLQGMIRDFCGIARKTLFEEIKALREAVEAGTAPQGVSSESVDAIDAVRSIGNIGAHMEADINVIVSVDPGEAQVLIELIESLFDEWYVAREKRRIRFAAVKAVAEEKKAFVDASRAAKTLSEPAK